MNGKSAHYGDDVYVDLIVDLLPAAEADAVLQHLHRCADCEKRFQQLAGQWERAAAYAHIATNAPTDATEQATGVWARLAWALQRPRIRVAFAAAVAVLLILLVPKLVEKPGEVLPGKLPAIRQDVELRAVVPPVQNEELVAGLDAYAREDFDEAVRRLRAIVMPGPQDAFRKVYLSSALVWIREYTEAIQILESVPLDLVPEPWSGEARWTLYVALRGAGHTARADSLLEDLQNQPGALGDRARSARKQR